MPKTAVRKSAANDPKPDALSKDSDAFDGVLASWAQALPGVDLASVSLSVRISRLAGLFNRGVDDLTRPYGFGYGELELLFFLLSAGPPYAMRPKELIKGCFVTSGAITGRVDRLEKLGLVTRVPSKIDRRETKVHLTDEGQAIARDLQAKVARDSGLKLALAAFAPEQTRALEQSIRQLLINIEALFAGEA